MGTGRSFNKKPKTRPKKNTVDKARRERLHRDRLIGLGVDAEVVRHMDSKAVRTMLKRPVKVAADHA